MRDVGARRNVPRNGVHAIVMRCRVAIRSNDTDRLASRTANTRGAEGQLGVEALVEKRRSASGTQRRRRAALCSRYSDRNGGGTSRKEDQDGYLFFSCNRYCAKFGLDNRRRTSQKFASGASCNVDRKSGQSTRPLLTDETHSPHDDGDPIPETTVARASRRVQALTSFTRIIL